MSGAAIAVASFVLAEGAGEFVVAAPVDCGAGAARSAVETINDSPAAKNRINRTNLPTSPDCIIASFSSAGYWVFKRPSPPVLIPLLPKRRADE